MGLNFRRHVFARTLRNDLRCCAEIENRSPRLASGCQPLAGAAGLHTSKAPRVTISVIKKREVVFISSRLHNVSRQRRASLDVVYYVRPHTQYIASRHARTRRRPHRARRGRADIAKKPLAQLWSRSRGERELRDASRARRTRSASASFAITRTSRPIAAPIARETR